MKKQGIRGLAAGILLALSVAMTAAAGPADEIIAMEAQGQQVPQAEGVQQVQAPGSPVVDVAGPGAAGAQTPPEQQADAAAMAAWQQAQAEALAAQQAALQAQQAALTTQGMRQLDPNRPMVALTFDDGPYAKVGNRIMDCAAQYNAKVTFYVVGDRVNTYASEMRRMVNEGHEVGNHTMNHKILTKIGAGEIAAQIEKCNQAVQNVTGIRPRTVRLPGGGKNSTVLANISQPIILWNLDTLDWKHRNAATSVQKVLSSVKDGDVILMHELYTASADAACQLIPELTARGYQLVTVSELAQYRGGLNNNRVYYSFGR
ncbi:MAG TPA: polysaccharide deacetylase [Lachnoclostridium sp.]|nr:polysaccharide deacetylase [Lachnoclostridium sp.]